MGTRTEILLQTVNATLHSAVLCDILDSLGYRNQAMHRRLRPLLQSPASCGFVGRARTLRWIEVDYVDPKNPYGREIEAMDSLGPGDVVVFSTDHARTCAPWGELMTTVAVANGAVGCVCDGNVRDSLKIIKAGFPVFCAGLFPADSKGRGMVDAFDVPVRCGDISVRPGDLIFADFDGIVVIPQSTEEAVLQLALEKVTKENAMRDELRAGMTLQEAYQRYDIL